MKLLLPRKMYYWPTPKLNIQFQCNGMNKQILFTVIGLLCITMRMPLPLDTPQLTTYAELLCFCERVSKEESSLTSGDETWHGLKTRKWHRVQLCSQAAAPATKETRLVLAIITPTALAFNQLPLKGPSPLSSLLCL